MYVRFEINPLYKACLSLYGFNIKKEFRAWLDYVVRKICSIDIFWSCWVQNILSSSNQDFLLLFTSKCYIICDAIPIKISFRIRYWAQSPFYTNNLQRCCRYGYSVVKTKWMAKKLDGKKFNMNYYYWFYNDPLCH